MTRMVAQGDILIERVGDAAVSGAVVGTCGDGGSVVVAEGEGAGHRHRMLGAVTLYRDERLARDMPYELYVGHLLVCAPTARLVHDEHDTIVLEKGTYRIRRQRCLDPGDVDFIEDWAS